MSDKIKKCCICKETKLLIEFYKNDIYKDKHFNCCKTCFKKRKKKHYQNNKEKIKKYNKKYQEENREEYLEKLKQYYKKNKKQMNKISKINWHKKFPWEKTLYYIMNRCIYNRHNSYALRGIKCLITKEELKILWFRDKAYDLQQASIDRKNPDGDYTFNNCRYIEMSENRRNQRGKIPKKI